jgi:uncharacterized cofD-like protein
MAAEKVKTAPPVCKISDLKIVAIGGGSGLSVLLRGFKQVTREIVAVVAMSDDGGGSGVLREDLGMLPPGDIRSCIVALANQESVLLDLLNYRFKEGNLRGQNLGNLMIAALSDISNSFEEAVRIVHEIFAVTGRVLPVTLEDVRLKALLTNGEVVEGESRIPIQTAAAGVRIEKLSIVPELPKALDEVLVSLEEADVIVMGPGSLYTSILPNLLVDGVAEAIRRSKAPKVFVVNLMSQRGETDGYTIRDYYLALERHVGEGLVSHVLINNEEIEGSITARYEAECALPVLLRDEDRQFFEVRGIELILDDFVEVVKGYVRHDALKVAQRLETLVDIKIYHHPREEKAQKKESKKESKKGKLA